MKPQLPNWRLQRCCFCSSLQFGCIVIGSIIMILQLGRIFCEISALEEINEKTGSIGNEDFQEKALIRYMMFLVLSFSIFVFGLSIIVSTLKKFTILIKANAGILLVGTFVYTAFKLLNQPSFSERGSSPDKDVDIAVGFYLLLIVKLIVSLYITFVLWSYALELEDESLKGYSSS